MADLLLELFSEEIPARMQADAIEHLKSTLMTKLIKEGIVPNHGWAPSGYVTPRRLAVWATDIQVEQSASETEVKGPRVGAPEAALQGFLKKTGLAQADLSERDGVYVGIVRKQGRNTAELLKTLIEEMLLAFPWPKSMRWGNGKQAWVRPLHSILCIFDGKVIPVHFAGITAGNTTQGHRFLAPQALTITNPSEYENTLLKANVIASRDKRQADILNQAEKAAGAAGLPSKKTTGCWKKSPGWSSGRWC